MIIKAVLHTLSCFKVAIVSEKSKFSDLGSDVEETREVENWDNWPGMPKTERVNRVSAHVLQCRESTKSTACTCKSQLQYCDVCYRHSIVNRTLVQSDRSSEG